MTEAEVAAVGDWVAAALPRLGLTDWRVVIDPTPPANVAMASTTTTFGQRIAVLQIDLGHLFDPVNVAASLGRARCVAETLTHELVHLMHGDLDALLSEALALADEPVRRWVESIVRNHFEHLVEAAALALVTACPDLVDAADAVVAAYDTAEQAALAALAAPHGAAGR